MRSRSIVPVAFAQAEASPGLLGVGWQGRQRVPGLPCFGANQSGYGSGLSVEHRVVDGEKHSMAGLSFFAYKGLQLASGDGES